MTWILAVCFSLSAGGSCLHSGHFYYNKQDDCYLARSNVVTNIKNGYAVCSLRKENK